MSVRLKKTLRWTAVVAAVAVGAVAGGSLYLLAYSLTPRKTMRARNAAAREVMTAEYPFLEPWRPCAPATLRPARS